MKNELIEDIHQYIAHLNEEGLFVTVHGSGISGLLNHNIHRNSFCSLVKTDDRAWEKCIACQQKVYKEYRKRFFFGMCHAGVEEYVFFVNEKTFISVSGYGIHKEKALERINRLSQNFFLKKSELLQVYESALNHRAEDLEYLTCVIKPLCHMLYLLQLLTAGVPEKELKNNLPDLILMYVQRNFMQDISIQEIAQACSCSESTVSHLFKQHTGFSIKKYVAKLRMEQAKKLLYSSNLPVSTIALMCGFSNINYFPTSFKKYTGVSPTVYRAQIADYPVDNAELLETGLELS